jgi:D-alanyl-D-alanine carboxypeptidase (penicillin-binding protein 5/6)
MLFSLFSFSIFSFELEEIDATIEAYYIFDKNSGTHIAEKNLNKPISPSSTVKIMTACLVLESTVDFDQVITITPQMLKGVSGRTMELTVGDKLTIDDLLYAMLCGGYNDASVALALSVSPTLNEFIKLMNEKAALLGMNSTQYTDVTGMEDSSSKTTVQDLAKLAKYIAENEKFVEICSTKNYRLSDVSTCKYSNIKNRSHLLDDYRGLANFNVGSGESGQCAITYYKSGNATVISIVMNVLPIDEDDDENYAESYTQKLLSHTIEDYSIITVKTTKEVITSLPVKYSMSGLEIDLHLAEDVKLFLPKDINLETDLTYTIHIHGEELKAPIKAGVEVGVLTITKDGDLLSSTPIISKVNVEKNTFLFTLDMMKNYVTGRSFIIALITFVVLIIAYYSVSKQKFRKKKRTRKNKSKIIKK